MARQPDLTKVLSKKTIRDLLPKKKKNRGAPLLPNQRPNAKAEKKLNPRELVFVLEYCKDWNASRAYGVAYEKTNPGTCGTEGFKLLRKPKILAAVQCAQRQLVNSKNLDREKILDEALDTYYKAKADKPVLDREGNHTGMYVFQGMVAVKALELVCKMCGFIQNKVLMSGTIDHNVNQTSVVVKISDLPLTVEEKRRLITLIKEKEAKDKEAPKQVEGVEEGEE